jgi:hypothetical protein
LWSLCTEARIARISREKLTFGMELRRGKRQKSGTACMQFLGTTFTASGTDPSGQPIQTTWVQFINNDTLSIRSSSGTASLRRWPHTPALGHSHGIVAARVGFGWLRALLSFCVMGPRFDELSVRRRVPIASDPSRSGGPHRPLNVEVGHLQRFGHKKVASRPGEKPLFLCWMERPGWAVSQSLLGENIRIVV